MNSIESIKTWYGELRTQKGNTIIIHDDQLPSARTGRMYLYNADRDAIIEYDKAIVDPKLFPLDKDQQKKAEADFGQAWLTTKELFLQAHGKVCQLTINRQNPMWVTSTLLMMLF